MKVEVLGRASSGLLLFFASLRGTWCKVGAHSVFVE